MTVTTLRVIVAGVVLSLGMVATPAVGDDFWHALADCESDRGRTSANQFQFTPDTWAKVGTAASPEDASYAEQRAAAVLWSQIISDPSSSAGWPVCWDVASAIHSTPVPSQESEPTPPAPPPAERRPTAPPATPTQPVSIALTG